MNTSSHLVAPTRCETGAGAVSVHRVQQGDLRRSFKLYYPRTACAGPFPKRTVFFLHCFGCTPGISLLDLFVAKRETIYVLCINSKALLNM